MPERASGALELESKLRGLASCRSNDAASHIYAWRPGGPRPKHPRMMSSSDLKANRCSLQKRTEVDTFLQRSQEDWLSNRTLYSLHFAASFYIAAADNLPTALLDV